MNSIAQIEYSQLNVGPMQNMSYIIWNPTSKNCFLVDPAWDAPFINEELKKNQLNPVFILLTHGHHDHHNAVEELMKTHDIPIYISKEEADILIPDYTNITQIDPHTAKLRLDDSDLTLFATPGHSPGGVCIKIEHLLITGDTLFINGCGRCDLGNSNVNDMYNSLLLIKTLPDELIVLPGHDYGNVSTQTLGMEKKTNRFLICTSKEQFIKKRMRKIG